MASTVLRTKIFGRMIYGLKGFDSVRKIGGYLKRDGRVLSNFFFFKENNSSIYFISQILTYAITINHGRL